MTMQRRHFELIAETLRECGQPRMGMTRLEVQRQKIEHELTVSAFANKLRVTNSQFNSDRFLRACGVGE